MNIYVGNLSYDTDDQALREVFEKYGSVDSVNVIFDKYSGRSKGFGFIEMPDNSEAQTALDELDGKELDGRNIKVNQANLFFDTSQNMIGFINSQSSSYKLFVSELIKKTPLFSENQTFQNYFKNINTIDVNNIGGVTTNKKFYLLIRINR